MADPVTASDMSAFERNVDSNFYHVRGDIKDSRHDVIRAVDAQGDRLTAGATANFIAIQDKFFALQKEVLDSKQEVIAVTIREAGATRDLINSTTQADLRMELLDARNRAERCVPRCFVDTSNGNGNGNGR